MSARSPLSSHSSKNATEEVKLLSSETKRAAQEAKPFHPEMRSGIPEAEEKGPSAKYKYLQQYPRRELYRLIVDGQYHVKETGWLGYENREPGCLKAVFAGLKIALTNLSRTKLSVAFIDKLHKACTRNVENMQEGTSDGIRSEENGIHSLVSFNATMASEEGIADLLEWISHHKHGPSFIVEARNRNDGTITYTSFTQPGSAKKIWDRIENQMSEDFLYRVYYSTPKPGPHIKKDMQKLFRKYEEQIPKANTPDEKLSVIVNFIWELDHLHSYRDANTRTFTICLLNRLLAQNGFPPPTFEVPNQFFGYSRKQMFDQLKKAIRVSEEIIAGKTDSFGFDTSSIPEKDSAYCNDASHDFFKHIQQQDRSDDQYKAELKNCFIADLEQCKKMGKANKFFHFFSFSNQDRIDASNKMIGLLRGELTAKNLTSKDVNVMMEPKSYLRRLITEYEKLEVLPKEFTEALAEKVKKYASEFDKRAFSRGFRRD